MPVIAVDETQVVDAAGTLQDMYQITFTIQGRPGSFTVTVPKDASALAAAEAAIGGEASTVNAIYGIGV